MIVTPYLEAPVVPSVASRALGAGPRSSLPCVSRVLVHPWTLWRTVVCLPWDLGHRGALSPRPSQWTELESRCGSPHSHVDTGLHLFTHLLTKHELTLTLVPQRDQRPRLCQHDPGLGFGFTNFCVILELRPCSSSLYRSDFSTCGAKASPVLSLVWRLGYLVVGKILCC